MKNLRENSSIYQSKKNTTTTFSGASGTKDITLNNQTGGLVTFDSANSKNMTEPLMKGQDCLLALNFTPVAAGTYQFTASLSFAEGDAPTPCVTKQTTVTVVTVTGANPVKLPPKMALNTVKQLKYTFTNATANKFNATGINLTTSKLDDLTITKQDIGGGNSVVIDPQSLKGTGTLEAGKEFVVTGNFKATEIGKNKGPSVTFHYNEGADIKFDGTTAGTEVEKVLVTCKISQDLPDTMKVKDTKPVQFTFTNTSDLPATNITITITKKE
ncbi:MAG: hypothetical protein REH83_01860 [Rickettsiella sp.]|nr:hypothetical protein [Rickettsiella sp.]